MADLKKPHDRLFLEKMGQPENAAAVLSQMLPEEVSKQIDWATLKRASERYAPQHSDPQKAKQGRGADQKSHDQVGKKHREGLAAASAPEAVGAEEPTSADDQAGGRFGVAGQEPVAIEGFSGAAVRAADQLQAAEELVEIAESRREPAWGSHDEYGGYRRRAGRERIWGSGWPPGQDGGGRGGPLGRIDGA